MESTEKSELNKIFEAKFISTIGSGTGQGIFYFSMVPNY